MWKQPSNVTLCTYIIIHSKAQTFNCTKKKILFWLKGRLDIHKMATRTAVPEDGDESRQHSFCCAELVSMRMRENVTSDSYFIPTVVVLHTCWEFCFFALFFMFSNTDRLICVSLSRKKKQKTLRMRSKQWFKNYFWLSECKPPVMQ